MTDQLIPGDLSHRAKVIGGCASSPTGSTPTPACR